MTLSLSIMSDGYCPQLEGLAMRGARFCKMRFASMFALLEHPSRGPVLFDTGYSSRFHEETRRFPGRLYSLLASAHVNLERTAVCQLRSRQINATDVRHIFVSHFHADHIGGLKDFPNARFHCTRAAVESVQNLRGWQAVRHGFLPGLLPMDFYQRIEFVDSAPIVRLPESHRPFSEARDVFGDGSLLSVELPGHATGQAGLFFKDASGRDCLLASDACWLSRAYRENQMPHPLVRILVDWAAYRQTLQELHELHRSNPSLWIIPSHCPEIWEVKQ